MVSPTSSPTPGTITDLINRLLDRGYNQIADPVLKAIASSTSSGIVQQRLNELDDEVKRLMDAGKKLTPDNPVLRALLADLEGPLRGDASLISSVSGDLQSNGSSTAGKIQRQLALPGMTDAQLAQLGIGWNTPDPEAIARLIGYVRSDGWAQLLASFPDDMLSVIQNQAIRGISFGWSPLRAAREIRRVINTLPSHVANNLMRTLMLTSYRDATALHQNANRQIAQRVVRVAALDHRTCLSCVAQHGQVIWDASKDAGAPVPRVNDHHSGRCTSIVIVKGVTRTIPTGPEWWNSLSPERKAQQMSLIKSPGKLEALLSGDATLADFIHTYDDPVFGEMAREASLKDVLK